LSTKSNQGKIRTIYVILGDKNGEDLYIGSS